MKPARYILLTSAILLSGPAWAQVRVRFAPVAGYADASGAGGQALPGKLRELKDVLETLGRERLGVGETLDLTVLNVDLAGIPTAPGYPRRITSTTPPRIRLAYVLKRDGAVELSGEEEVTDLNFLITQNPRASSGGLYYERRILRDWFDERFRSGHGRR